MVAVLLAHAPLYYQLPRWRDGLDPTFVHPTWMEQSPFPIFYHMAAVHPLVWICAHRHHFHSRLPELWMEVVEMTRLNNLRMAAGRCGSNRRASWPPSLSLREH